MLISIQFGDVMKKDQYKILITNHPSLSNKGDAAILLGILESIKQIPYDATLLSFYPKDDPKRCPKSIKLSDATFSYYRSPTLRIIYGLLVMFNHILIAFLYKQTKVLFSHAIIKKEIFKEYLDSDVVITGSDDSFTSKYGIGSFVLNCYTIWFAKLLNKPVMIFAGSVGPFNGIFEIWFGRNIINKVDIITVRELVSFDYLKSLGIKKHVYATTDPAFLLPCADSKRLDNILAENNITLNGLIIGVSVSKIITSWILKDTEEEKYHYYVDIMVKTINQLINELSANIIFISTAVDRKGFDDRIVANEIYSKIENKSHAIVISQDYSPEELKSLFSICSVCIASRTHAAIFSTSSGVPTIALSYTHKTKGIIGDLLGQQQYVIDIDTLTLKLLQDKIHNLLLNKDKIRNELNLKVKYAEKLAQQNGDLLAELLKTEIT